MAIQDKSVVILGGGIGGLAAALALHLKGAQVLVLEQAEAIKEVGAGIQVSPNGLRVIEALGLGADFAQVSVKGQAVSLRDYREGREVVRMDLTDLPDGQDYRFVHRSDLIDLLAKAVRAAGITIRLLQKADLVEPGNRPVVHLHTGDHVSGDLVIGADGLHSVLRPALNAQDNAFFTGQVAWRAVVPNTVGHPSEARVHMGPGRHMVTYPLRGGTLLNIVAVEERRDWVVESWTHRDNADNLRKSFAEFGGTVPEMLEQVDAPGLWGLFRHPVAERWHGPGVALLGDAAHPTLPFLAQGANMALEDGWVLGACLAQFDDPVMAFARYQEARQPRVARAIRTANGNAWKYHLRNPLLREAAHFGLGLMGRIAPGRLVHQFDWLYGHDVTQAS